ncbi:DUF4233 domain-containing protein [Cellulomonas fimi]|uniref:DUF4233 domain-containing protein n=1 Tax=Cellulomonas fimi TaxID=1708 RepID=UPI00234DED71|nr:DUF4233 domain-containing protein [Cellulomonas fimi]MDC7121568.1 DUF4233 domain-containing protein [Cellulomonas fimi]
MSSTDPQAVRRKRPAKPQFTQTMLILEAFVVFFATLVAYGLRVADTTTVWWVGGSLTVVLIVLAGWVGRPGGYVAGSVAQVVVLACGFVVPMMFVVGAVFAALWVFSLRVGGRIDRERAEWDAAHPGMVGP